MKPCHQGRALLEWSNKESSLIQISTSSIPPATIRFKTNQEKSPAKPEPFNGWTTSLIMLTGIKTLPEFHQPVIICQR